MAMLAADLACALDPVQLSQRIALEPDDWQADVLWSAAPWQLVNCRRYVPMGTLVATARQERGGGVSTGFPQRPRSTGSATSAGGYHDAYPTDKP
jgi:hypothetical protein